MTKGLNAMNDTGTIRFVESGVTAAEGFEAAGAEGGIRYRNRHDVGIVRCVRRASAAAVFTRNRFVSPSIKANRMRLSESGGYARAVVVNAGNANACTGQPGLENALEMGRFAANALGVPETEALVASTGVIGEPLPMEPLKRGIAGAVRALRPNGGEEFARAIMTTDTRPKIVAVETGIGGKLVRVGGCCKGAGMIAPNMGTMLAFLTTDAAVEPGLLSTLLRNATARTFNRVTVDGDQSTNDTVFLLASGLSATIESRAESETRFAEALETVCRELAKQIARDGEGATKLIEVTVRGAKDEEDADRAARAIADSPLVKTAVYGNDANWGRILCALGYSGAEFDPDLVELWIEDLQLVKNGMRTDYREEDATAMFSRDPLHIVADVRAGNGSATFWTCDLTEGYIRENASYRS